MTEISLRRYTTLPFLLQILQTKTLTLLDPTSWDDRNDAYYLELYSKSLSGKSVLALCFAESEERYHHWKVYAGSSSGVCIEFVKDELLGCFPAPEYRSDYVKYQTLDEPDAIGWQVNLLPFLKRYAFCDEREFRIIYIGGRASGVSKNVPIPIASINRIILNPWIHKAVFQSVRNVLRGISGCRNLRIVQTTVTDNDQWKRKGDAVLGARLPEV